MPATVTEWEPIGLQEIMNNISTSIHDDPASMIAHFELLLDEEINDAIESITQYYNFQ